ncbi:methylated-DNA--[protein]-cysteine S-methyltransferase [Kitasatospora phosalacinea]|uniref:methylated-DNA--[protein]-cysteine S-methyltransferase n=1 Tax=Kitasatospora phosalacinea TaxID=2065 RepID=UPI0036658DDC
MQMKGRQAVDTVAVVEHRTPIGRVTLAATDQALLYCGFAGAAEVRARVALDGSLVPEPGGKDEGQGEVLCWAREELDDYLSGEQRAFTVPVDLRLATPFSRTVNLALDAHVPYGTRTSYGALATALGRPGAARAVGAALGANPVCVVLPCHRVVGASGSLTGYAGGVPAKRFLLELEAGHRAA